MRAVLLSLVLLVAAAIGPVPAAAQEGGAQPARQAGPRRAPRFSAACRSARPRRNRSPSPILDAINRALERNLGLLLSENGVGRAGGLQKMAMSALHAEHQGARLRVAADREPGRVRVSAARGRPVDRRPVQPVRRPRLRVAGRARLPGAQRQPRGTAQRRGRPAQLSERARSRRARRGERVSPGAGGVGARRRGAGPGRHGAGPLQPDGQPAPERHRRRHRRPARGSAAQHRTPARHGDAERVREGQAPARADHRPAGRTGDHAGQRAAAGAEPGHLARGRARTRLPDAARLPGGARAREGGRSRPRGRAGRGAAVGARERRLRRHRAVGGELSQHLRDRRRAERPDLPGWTPQGPPARGRRRPAQPPRGGRRSARRASTTT